MIPQTLLWVGLIVAWLVVLVPMLAARHPRVNQVSDATLKTRLLHRGGSATRAVRRRIRPAATVAEERADEADLREDDAEPREDGRIVLGKVDDEPAGEDLADEDAEAHAYVDSDVDDLHGAGPMDGDTTPIPTVERAAMRARASIVDLDALASKADAADDTDAAAPESEPIVRRVTAPVVPAAEDDLVADELDAADDLEAVDDLDATDELDDAEPVDGLADEDLADDQLTEEITPATRPKAEPAEIDARGDSPHRRRGGYDPENDARLTEARFRFRQRVTLVLGVLAVVALGAGLMDVPFAWYGLGAVVLALAVYLTYLRRTVRIEAEIRRRRTARLERARREREREAEVLDGVPAHLRRGGCVVMEIDDEDPAFDHLPRYRAEEFDFLDRPADVREPYERKVG
ncbi:gephyrin-like molybdotransferase receptor GlpR [Tsukamurella sp. NPDC003166]|uniref:divisome protein SepX/GlpR n=1 Tax=Tsukamurella sp. NPDC003166 TaxID=3154444 RepID=UPI0033B00402